MTEAVEPDEYEPSFWNDRPIMHLLAYPRYKNVELDPVAAEKSYDQALADVSAYLQTHDLADDLADDADLPKDYMVPG